MTNRLFTACAALAFLAGSAVAGPKQQAKKHIDKATKLHKEGKFADALVELDAAYKLDPKPDLLFAIGQVHAKMGNCTEATDAFQKFAKAKHDKQVDEVVDEAIKSCKPADDPLAHIDSTPSPPPTEQTTPPPPFETNEHEQPPAAVAPAPPAPPAPPPPSPPSPLVSGPPPAVVATLPAPHHFYQDELGDALVVVGVGAIVGAIVEYHSARTISVVLGIGGVVLAGGGVAHMMLSGHSGEQPAVSAAPTRGGALVTWSGGF